MEKQKTLLNLNKEYYEQALFLQNLEHSKQLQKQLEEFEESMIVTRSKEEQLQRVINVLKKQIETLQEEHCRSITKLKDDCGIIQECCQRLLEEKRTVIESKTAELDNKEQELKIFQQEIIGLQKEHAFEVEKIRKAHQLEIQDIEFEFLKTMTELQNEKDIVLQKNREIEEKARKEMEQLHQVFHNEKATFVNECDQKMKEVSVLFLCICNFSSFDETQHTSI